MQSYVSKRLIDPNGTVVAVSDVKDALNEAISYWKLRRFWFNEIHDKDTLTAQSPTFPYPSNYLMPATDDDGFYIEYGNVRYPMVKVEQSVYDALYLANGYGMPRWYARLSDDEYQCYPIPNIAYTVGRHYLKDYADLVNPDDTNDFTTHAARLVELWALATLITEFRQDVQMGDYYRTASQNEYRNLRLRTDKENATGKLTLETNLNRR